MKLKTGGKSILKAEVVNVSSHGIWLLACDKEYFLPYDDFPWFKNAIIGAILDVQLVHGHHLRWPQLDVDLELQSLKNIEQYPLVYK